MKTKLILCAAFAALSLTSHASVNVSINNGFATVTFTKDSLSYKDPLSVIIADYKEVLCECNANGITRAEFYDASGHKIWILSIEDSANSTYGFDKWMSFIRGISPYVYKKGTSTDLSNAKFTHVTQFYINDKLISETTMPNQDTPWERSEVITRTASGISKCVQFSVLEGDPEVIDYDLRFMRWYLMKMYKLNL